MFIRPIVALILSVWTMLLNVPPASASSCSHVEVVFARGTDQPAGVGDVGQSFIDALRHKGVGDVTVYAVNYPASRDFANSTVAGVIDAGHHIQFMAAHCPTTRLVLGGYSQGAAVAGFVTSPVVPPGVDVGDLQPSNPAIADHVAAVVLFGTPSPTFLGMIGVPGLVIGPLYADKTTQLCNDGDPVCSTGSDWAAHVTYAADGQADNGAMFAAWRI